MKQILLGAFAFLFSVGVSASERTSDILNEKGNVIGKASVFDTPRGVLLKVYVNGLNHGLHGMHFHNRAQCDFPNFSSAGPHIHKSEERIIHGYFNKNSNDFGDLPNLYVHKDGIGNAEIYTERLTFNGNDKSLPLFDADGSALIIHENPDDYKTQPIGGSGNRVACALFK